MKTARLVLGTLVCGSIVTAQQAPHLRLNGCITAAIKQEPSLGACRRQHRERAPSENRPGNGAILTSRGPI